MSCIEKLLNYVAELNKYSLFIAFSILLLCLPVASQAQQFDRAYLKWKAEQQAQDAQLKKVDDNYYLSRPDTAQTSKSSAKDKAKMNLVQSSSQIGSKISLNSATATQLQQLSGVGAKKAQAIIEYRDQYGKFQSIEDLKKVKGIGPALFEKNRSQLGL